MTTRILALLAASLLAASFLAAGCSQNFPPAPAPAAVPLADAGKTSGDGANSGPEKLQSPAIPPRFADVARDVGIDFTFFNDAVPGRFFLPEVMGGGAGWLDYDLDGRLDLYLANGCELKDPDPLQQRHTSRLFRNAPRPRRDSGAAHDRPQNDTPCTFIDVTNGSGAGHNGFGQGIAVADFDADGFPDVYLGCYGSNVLFHNNGDGSFADVTAAAGCDDPLWTSSVAWLDVDFDGDLDLYVCNYMDVTWRTHKVCQHDGKPRYCGPGDHAAVPDHVFLNAGDGSFVEASVSLGLVGADGKGLAVTVADFNDDLIPEIYVANDMTANFLFTRDRPPAQTQDEGTVTNTKDRQRRTSATIQYKEVGIDSGCALSESGLNEASMGIALGDFDNDSRPDLFLTHFHNSKNTLYHNLGDLLFVDDSRRTRIAATSYEFNGFGTVAFDYDRDGSQDLIISNGHVLGPEQSPYKMQPQMLHNNGQGIFADVSSHAGPYFQEKWLGRSLAAADFDDDGDLDFAVTHLDAPAALLRNDTATGRHWIGFSLKTFDRVPPVGGRVVVQAGDRTQTRAIVSGGSYLASSDPRLLFGVLDAVRVRVEIHWPSGHVDTWDDLPTDRYWELWEGRAPHSLI